MPHLLAYTPAGPWAVALPAAAAAVLAFLLGEPIRRMGLRVRIMDEVTHRSSHTRPVPRVGGMSIILAALFAALIFFIPTPPFLLALAVGVVIAVISFFDDLLSLPSIARLLVHLVVSGSSIWVINLCLDEIQLPFVTLYLPHWLGFILATFFVVAFINFFNFMDGINGIAAAQGIWGGLTLSILLLWGGAGNSVITAAVLAGGCLGYLPHNFPRARMFMGDVGSTTIGFGLAMLTLIGGTRTPISWVACLLPLLVFLYDAAFTLTKRILRGENFLKAHREHHYQLLVRSGWTHTQATGLQMALMTVCSAAALAYPHVGNAGKVALLAGLAVLMASYSVFVHALFRKHAPAPAAAPAAEPAQG